MTEIFSHDTDWFIEALPPPRPDNDPRAKCLAALEGNGAGADMQLFSPENLDWALPLLLSLIIVFYGVPIGYILYNRHSAAI